jgi:arylsulfatase A-like enzyme
MSRSLVLLATLATAVAAQAAAATEMPDTSKMNVLLIDIEDCYAGVWGCYGNTICKTPNLDRFARTAVRFDSAYCQAISCNPSRTSFLSGLRPPSTHVFTNNEVMNDHLPPGTITLPEMFKAKGFYTADIGKLFHTVAYAQKQMATFDRIEYYDKPDGWKGPGPILNFPPAPPRGPQGAALKKLTEAEKKQIKRANSDRYGDSGLQPEQERDYQMAATAAALLKEFAQGTSTQGKPFFLAVSQSRPHTPLVAPKRYIDMYDPNTIPMPPAQPESFVNMPPQYIERSRGGNPDIFTQKQPTPEQTRAAIAAYYACVSFVDDNVGRILDALDRTGLADNTIVIFLGDHGFHLGDHHFWSKYSMLEATRRVALIVRVPGAPANGRVCREFVEFVDLVPTIGQLVGLKLPGNLEGTSFVPLLTDPERPWKSAVFMSGGSRDPGQVVRNRRYSYLEYKQSSMPAALFDLEKDPWETRNVVDDPNYASARREMADLLHAVWKAALPPGVKSTAGE